MGCCGSSSSSHVHQQSDVEKVNALTPLDLLKIRLAKGEISFKEYAETKAVLQQ